MPPPLSPLAKRPATRSRPGVQDNPRLGVDNDNIFGADPRRCLQLVFIFDEPESALSPSRQILFLRLLRRMERLGHCQVIMATHSPLPTAYPARGCCFYRNGLDP
jgi:predicted ATP-dependent endonuclease of OLD family